MRKRASITVFSALAFALVASFLMALLEAGRVYQIQTYADMKSTLALESVCAEYQPVLWEEFHLLGLDGAYGGDIFSMDHVTAVLRERLDRNLDVDGAGGSILQVTLAGAEPVAYRLMTDQEGSVFLHCVAAYMKQNMAMETIRALQERYGEHEQVEQSGQGEESIEDARTAIEEAKSERREQAECGRDGSGDTGTSAGAGKSARGCSCDKAERTAWNDAGGFWCGLDEADRSG